ncbi:MAG TPA: hypothetical protein VFG30_42705 [Polyangiales bacterium]|nr:hypothetical protein [Polyangiales bacterium]
MTKLGSFARGERDEVGNFFAAGEATQWVWHQQLDAARLDLIPVVAPAASLRERTEAGFDFGSVNRDRDCGTLRPHRSSAPPRWRPRSTATQIGQVTRTSTTAADGGGTKAAICLPDMAWMAQRDTIALSLLICACALGACARTNREADAGADATVLVGAAGDGGGKNSGPPECKTRSDCELVPARCCVCPASDPWSFDAKPKQRPDAQTTCASVSCAPCPAEDRPPLAPVYWADCVERRCVRIDLRMTDLSRCASDDDCTPVPLGCCGASSDAPVEYVGLRSDADTAILRCDPAPPCDPGPPHGEPNTVCAVDGHCSVVRRRVSQASSAGASHITQVSGIAKSPTLLTVR